METRLKLSILPQPDDVTCGPTCLHAVYSYYGDVIPLAEVIAETPQLEQGGTLAVQLGCHALGRGYEAIIYTWNLQVFDPTWFRPDAPPLDAKLRAQIEVKERPKLQVATDWYLRFLERGGQVRMVDFTNSFIRQQMKAGAPILTGLSATYLYGCAREFGPQCTPDDVQGYPVGHFVVVCGYDQEHRKVLVADPFRRNPLGPEHYYEVGVDRLIRAVLLGILTYDANLLVVRPGARAPAG